MPNWEDERSSDAGSGVNYRGNGHADQEHGQRLCDNQKS